MRSTTLLVAASLIVPMATGAAQESQRIEKDSSAVSAGAVEPGTLLRVKSPIFRRVIAPPAEPDSRAAIINRGANPLTTRIAARSQVQEPVGVKIPKAYIFTGVVLAAAVVLVVIVLVLLRDARFA